MFHGISCFYPPRQPQVIPFTIVITKNVFKHYQNPPKGQNRHWTKPQAEWGQRMNGLTQDFSCLPGGGGFLTVTERLEPHTLMPADSKAGRKEGQQDKGTDPPSIVTWPLFGAPCSCCNHFTHPPLEPMESLPTPPHLVRSLTLMTNDFLTSNTWHWSPNFKSRPFSLDLPTT